jgi:hypothetical protein
MKSSNNGGVCTHLIARLFGGNHPVRDARPSERMMVNVTADDWKRGKRNNPRRCAIARACNRALALPEGMDLGMAILKRVAYVPLPSDKSPTGFVVIRYMLTNKAHVHWDGKAKITPGMVALQPPTQRQGLEVKRQFWSNYRRTRREEGRPVRRKRKPFQIGKQVVRVRGGLYHHHHVVIKGGAL